MRSNQISPKLFLDHSFTLHRMLPLTKNFSRLSLYNMPRRYRPRRPRRRTARRSRNKKRIGSRGGLKRGRKFGGLRLSKPINLKLPYAGMPVMVNTTLRYCTTVVLDPRVGTGTGTPPSGNSEVNYLTNGLIGPGFPPAPVPANASCPLGHDDFAVSYSNYRVNSSRMTVRVSPYSELRNATGPIAVPTYVTLYLQNQSIIAGGTPELVKNDIDSMRAQGHRFLKVDPNVIYSGTATGIARSGNMDSQSCTKSWSSKYIDKNVDDSKVQAQVNRNPEYTQYYCLLALQPHGGPLGQTRDPTPVQCLISIEYNITYWRKRTLQIQPQFQNITSPTVPAVA